MNLDIETIKSIAIPLGAVITWFFKDRVLSALNIKREKSDIESGQLENVQKALDLWQEMLDDAVKRHKLQVGELEIIIEKLKNETVELAGIIADQKELIIKQSKTIAYYKNKYEKNKENE